MGQHPYLLWMGEPPPVKKTVHEERSKQSSHAYAKHFSCECENSSQSAFKETIKCVVSLRLYIHEMEMSSNQTTLTLGFQSQTSYVSDTPSTYLHFVPCGTEQFRSKQGPYLEEAQSSLLWEQY